jgi:hypothetical protein
MATAQPLKRGALAAIAGAALIGVSLVLPWLAGYVTSCLPTVFGPPTCTAVHTSVTGWAALRAAGDLLQWAPVALAILVLYSADHDPKIATTTRVLCVLAGIGAMGISWWAYGNGYTAIGVSVLLVGGLVAVIGGALYPA